MIYIDASRYSNTDKKTGVENYSFHLIDELMISHPNEIILVSPRTLPMKAARQLVISFPRLWTQIRLSAEVLWNRKIKKLFIPSHVMPIIHPKKTVITLHDVAFRRYPEAYSRFSRWYLDWSTRFAVKRAWKIITPSQTTKSDLIQFYGADEKMIKIIPLGFGEQPTVSKQQVTKALQRYELKSKKYFLFLGRIELKKNLKTLLKAFEQLSQKYPDYQLVLAGKVGVGGEDILSSVEDKNLKIVVTGYVSDEEKWALLQQAACFVFPSLFEGFGLPLLEAMAMKVPIVCSNIPSSQEVMGNLPVYFDAENSEELAHRIHEVLKHPELMKKLTDSYKGRLQHFSWKKAAEETWSYLQG